MQPDEQQNYDIQGLVGALEREKAAIGVFVTLENPSKDMNTEAVTSGYYTSEHFGRDFPKIQILTIEELALLDFGWRKTLRQLFI